MRSGQTHYTPPAGIPELRQALADLYTEHHGLPTQAAQVVVSNGAKHSIHNALMAVCGPGRRGDHPRALLGQLFRPGQADRARPRS